MKVRDLIEHLQKHDPEMPVVTISGPCDDVYLVRGANVSLVLFDEHGDPIFLAAKTDPRAKPALVI
jgi:hypothetical protein